MTTRRALAILLAAASAGAGLLPAGAGGETAPRVKPSPGVYEARPAKIKESYSQGAFAVVSEGGKRRIVAVEGNLGIFYPDQDTCGNLGLALATESIPVNGRGRFSVRDSYGASGTQVTVRWKGRWKKPKRVSGSIRIASKDCADEFKWTGRRLPAR